MHKIYVTRRWVKNARALLLVLQHLYLFLSLSTRAPVLHLSNDILGIKRRAIVTAILLISPNVNYSSTRPAAFRGPVGGEKHRFWAPVSFLAVLTAGNRLGSPVATGRYNYWLLHFFGQIGPTQAAWPLLLALALGRIRSRLESPRGPIRNPGGHKPDSNPRESQPR